MKFVFKIQPYQTEAVKAVTDVFKGQERQEEILYKRDLGLAQPTLYVDDLGYKNNELTLSPDRLLQNIREIQQKNGIKQSANLLPLKDKVSPLNLDIEMETGTGKTYVYIKTIFELNKQCGFTKFIVVVPSIAIREGVRKSFADTSEHFLEHYRKKARVFVYDSRNLTALDHFSKDNNIQVMIINMQAFATSFKEEEGGKPGRQNKEARIIFSQQDNFASRRPIEVLAANRPILILDEPQRMGGPATQKGLKRFNPLFTLNYSATHRKKNNCVYILDPLNAYNQKLVKKIEVKGFEVKHLPGTEAYFYLQEIILSPSEAPKARLEIEVKRGGGLKKERRIVTQSTGDIYILSGGLEQYRGYTLAEIDARENCLRFTNGEIVRAGELIGDTSEEAKRRVQIRETILSHFEKEEKLYERGIKVLSLFFIDEVAKYRQYGEHNEQVLGEYGQIFEEEYLGIAEQYRGLFPSPYRDYLPRVGADVTKIHTGYFSVDKQGKTINSTTNKRGGEGLSDDISAYDLILKNKERLLSLAEPTRFIFSHSALREGWDNPNVFQICALKHSDNTDSKRQEVGRGLRLCLDSSGERMDVETCGEEVHDINKLTVIASESYAEFVTDLQGDIHKEMLEIDRPTRATIEYFTNKNITIGEYQHKLTAPQAKSIEFVLIQNGYVNEDGALTESYQEDVNSGTLKDFSDPLIESIIQSLPPEMQAKLKEKRIVSEINAAIHLLARSVYDENVLKSMFEDGHQKAKVENRLNDNFHKKEFQKLWQTISPKYGYRVEFDSAELIKNSIKSINQKLDITQLQYTKTVGQQKETLEENALAGGDTFETVSTKTKPMKTGYVSSVKYDLIGKVVQGTKLTRLTVAKILCGMAEPKLRLFDRNPEEFITKVSHYIMEQKATMTVEHIAYAKSSEEPHKADIFTVSSKSDFARAIKMSKHVQDYVVTDSKKESVFANNLELAEEVCVYAKLPRGFSIPTPMGNYAPDWAIVFNEGAARHIYFVAETKGSLDSLQLRPIEKAKINCARKLFETMSQDVLAEKGMAVKYDVVTNYEELLVKVMR